MKVKPSQQCSLYMTDYTCSKYYIIYLFFEHKFYHIYKIIQHFLALQIVDDIVGKSSTYIFSERSLICLQCHFSMPQKRLFFQTVMLYRTAVAAITLSACISLERKVKPNKATKIGYSSYYYLTITHSKSILFYPYCPLLQAHLIYTLCIKNNILHNIDYTNCIHWKPFQLFKSI